MIMFSYWAVFLLMGGLGAVLGFIFRDREDIKYVYDIGYKAGYKRGLKDVEHRKNEKK